MLNTAYAEIPKHDVVIVIGYQKAKVGADNPGSDESIGQHVMGTINVNSERLLETCFVNN